MSLASDEVIVARREVLTLGAPNIQQTNELAMLLLTAPGAKALIGQIGDVVKQVREATPREDDESDGAYAGRVLRSALSWALGNLDAAVGIITEGVAPLLAERAALVAVVALDTARNRARLAADPEWVAAWGDPKRVEVMPGQESVPHTLRSRYSPALRAWALESIEGSEAIAVAMRTMSMLMGGGVGKPSGTLSPVAPTQESAPEGTSEAPTTST